MTSTQSDALKLLLAAGLTMAISACSSNKDGDEDFAFPAVSGAVLPFTVLRTLPDGVVVRQGGYGSGMAAHPTRAGYFYAMTDRGSNTDFTGSAGVGKKFSVPDYAPRIGLFRLDSAGEVEQLSEILLKDRSGNPITGLPNVAFGATGEVAYASDGAVLVPGNDPNGLDSEGLVALADGSFWVSDEYGPHIVHFNASGVEIDRINPFADDIRDSIVLPREFANRRANRGMEGLAITPDGKTLVGVMQSTMNNPTAAAATNKSLTRIVTINLETRAIAQYLYRQEAAGISNCDVVALSATTFLVIERDGGGGFVGNPEALLYKRLYKFDISGATDVENPALVNAASGITDSAATGLLIDGKTLEGTSWETLAAKGIVPVTKTLVYDALVAPPMGINYPHDKLEGLWLIDATHVGLLNDDDFGVIGDTVSGNIIAKIRPDNGSIDAGTLYVVTLPTPLF